MDGSFWKNFFTSEEPGYVASDRLRSMIPEKRTVDAESICRELIEWADDPELRDRKPLHVIIEKARKLF